MVVASFHLARDNSYDFTGVRPIRVERAHRQYSLRSCYVCDVAHACFISRHDVEYMGVAARDVSLWSSISAFSIRPTASTVFSAKVNKERFNDIGEKHHRYRILQIFCPNWISK